MRLWIAEETEGNALFHATSKQGLMTEIREATADWSSVSCWHLWMIDPKLDREFLGSLVRKTFSFRDIPNKPKTFEKIYIRLGKKLPRPNKVVQRKLDPTSSEWGVG